MNASVQVLARKIEVELLPLVEEMSRDVISQTVNGVLDSFFSGINNFSSLRRHELKYKYKDVLQDYIKNSFESALHDYFK